MKSYVSDKQIRLVGKAWEVKHQLQLMLQHGDPAITVAQYLQGLCTAQKPASHQHSSRTRIIPFPLANA